MKHKCKKDLVKWDKNPTPSDNCIEWQGICECGKRVFEIYEQTPELYEINSGEEI